MLNSEILLQIIYNGVPILMKEHAIEFKNVSKSFRIYSNTKDKILDLITPGGFGERFRALYDVTFKVEKGEILGIIGINGSGKSTLSNIIAGGLKPESGTVTIDGEVSLVAISAGLNNQLSGRDNIELKGLMLGLTKSEIKNLEPLIIEFADIGRFIDQPVKTYSSGMKSRLGFAISVHINPDILVIDEALSVGDQTFYNKCINKMNEFKSEGKTIIFISHSIGQIKSFCTQVLWLEFGRVKEYGPVNEVLANYTTFLSDFNKWTSEQKAEYRKTKLDAQYTRIQK